MVGSRTKDVKRGLRSGDATTKIFGGQVRPRRQTRLSKRRPSSIRPLLCRPSEWRLLVLFMPRPKPSAAITSAPPWEMPRPDRSEWLTLLVIVLLAAGLRLAFPSRMAIEHFDEGVYASNIFFSIADGGQYPYRHLYAPPLLPWLIEGAIVFGGTRSLAPLVPPRPAAR